MSNGKNLDSGFYIDNTTGLTLRCVAYDPNKQRIRQNDVPIPNIKLRYISDQNIGTANYIYLLFFVDEVSFNAPPGIGIVSNSHGKSGGGGITIFGIGGSGSMGITVTSAFSQPVAAAKMVLQGYETPSSSKRWPKTHRWSVLNISGGASGDFDLSFTDPAKGQGGHFFGWGTDLPFALDIASKNILGS